MKILIYGSTLITEKVVDFIDDYYDIVGYIPSINVNFQSKKIDKRIVNDSVDHDIKLSIQYDGKVETCYNSFNVHTGLLPRWGGCNILYNTYKEKPKEQGLTFHKMTKEFDYGPIISKITYPVLYWMNEVDMYGFIINICPPFVLSSLRLLETIGLDKIDQCLSEKPTLYTRNNVEESDMERYRKIGKEIKEKWME